MSHHATFKSRSSDLPLDRLLQGWDYGVASLEPHDSRSSKLRPMTSLRKFARSSQIRDRPLYAVRRQIRSTSDQSSAHYRIPLQCCVFFYALESYLDLSSEKQFHFRSDTSSKMLRLT
jgi:hypothetical protein